MKVRSTKVRALVVLPVVAAATLGLSACDTKVGAAAVVNGNRVSEQTLNKYLTPKSQPIPSSNGASTPPRQFVLSTLVQIEAYKRVLAAIGGQPSDSDLAKAKDVLLQGGSEDQLRQNVTSLGLAPSFTDAFLRSQELLSMLRQRLSSAAAAAAAVKKADLHVSINPRYGTWNDQSLSLVGLSKKQFAPLLTLDGPLPGDSSGASSGQ